MQRQRGTARASLALVVTGLMLATGLGTVTFGGPTGPAGAAGGMGDGTTPSSIQIVDETGQAVPGAHVAMVNDGDNGPVAVMLATADAAGVVPGPFPATFDRLIVEAEGYATSSTDSDQDWSEITLEPGVPDETPVFLRFAPPADLACPTDVVSDLLGKSENCGSIGEPVVQTTPEGWIWASATCCIEDVGTPPIWLSTDGGASFSYVAPEGTSWMRERGGFEGDFAVDAAGNVYFVDFTFVVSYDKDGNHRHTMPLPFRGNDRPWIQAGDADELLFIYNGREQNTGDWFTWFHKSLTGGLTWEDPLNYENLEWGPLGGTTFPCRPATFGQGPQRSDLWVAAPCRTQGDEDIRVWFTTDSGDTWSGPEHVPLPETNPGTFGARLFYAAPAIDGGGTMYMVYTHALPSEDEVGVFVARRSAEGAWSGPFDVGLRGVNAFAWSAAGGAGHLAISTYHTDSTNPDEDPNAQWFTTTAVSVDADGAQPHFQITEVASKRVLTQGTPGGGGWPPLLGDFLQMDLMPDGRVVVGYSEWVPGDGQHENKVAVSQAPIGGGTGD